MRHTGAHIGRGATPHRLLVALLLGLVILMSSSLAIWAVGGELIAAAPQSVGKAPEDLEAQNVAFDSDSGSTIQGWFCRGAAGHGAVLLLHGVRGSRLDMISRAEFLHKLGYSVLLIDFQAHGESPGTKITFGYLESRDVVAALNYLHRELPAERVGVIGVSLGAAAFVLAEKGPTVDAAVLESMYPTIDQATKDRLRLHLGRIGPALAPLLMVQLQPRLGVEPEELRPIDRIRLVRAPVYLISGTLDRHTTIEEARALFSEAMEPKTFWAVEGAEHVDLHRFAGADYERKVSEFLGEYLQDRRPSRP